MIKNTIKFIGTFLALSIYANASGQVTGLWYNVDDEDGKPKSHIEITETSQGLEGRVVKLLPGATVTHCDKCDGELKGQKIEGMRIMYGVKKRSSKSYEDGKILDPKSGKLYDCDLSLEGSDKLKVRGYIGLSLFGRTQYWYRVK